MEPLDLDPGDYDGTYKLIGGRPALDFINTVSWPDTDRRHDWLSSPANLDTWCAANGLLSMPPAKASDLDRVRELRSELTTVVKPLAFDELPTSAVVEALNSRLTCAQAHRRIDPITLSWTWEPPTDILDRFSPVVLDTAEILTRTSHERLRHCTGCDWLFDDESRNSRRRWCDMADCGSRAKSRSYYHRTKTNTN